MKTYRILYLTSFLLTCLLFLVGNTAFYNVINKITNLYLIVGIPLVLLSLITLFIIFKNKKDIEDYNLLMPYLYLGLMLFLVCVIYLYNALGLNANNYVRVYYQSLLIIPFIVLSIYSIALFKKEGKRN